MSDAAAGYQLTPWLQPEVEVNYSHDFIDGDDDLDELAVTAGAIVNLPHGLRLDLGVQRIVYGRNAPFGTRFLVNFSVTL